MLFLNTKTGEYPRHIGDLEAMGWQQGSSLPEDWVQVQYAEPPILEKDEAILELEPKLVNGIYYQNLTKRQLTEQEIANRDLMNNARQILENLGYTPAQIAAIKLGL